MKKTIILALIGLSIASVSCRKQRTCECKTTETQVVTGFNAGTTVTYYSNTVTKDKQKKKEFKYSQSCFSTKDTYSDTQGSGQSYRTIVTTNETTCDLK